MDSAEIVELYRTSFAKLCTIDWKPWRNNYLSFADRVRRASKEEWITPRFQEYLWESDEVTGVGMGSSVILSSAYQDHEIAEALWSVRERSLPADFVTRGDAISSAYEDILKLVTPKHNSRRPSAKLVRAFAGIFPHDVLCLVDDYKTKQVRNVLGLKKQGEHFLKQHTRLRQELSKIIGPEETLEAAVEHSMFAWLLYQQALSTEDEPSTDTAPLATVPPSPQSEAVASPIRMLSRDRQYKGMNHVQDALRLMYAIVRDSEHGITRKDLISNVQIEAPYLSAKSANMQIGIAQQRLGILELHDGDVFRPSEKGRELLEGETASNVLTPILVRRVWGFAQALDVLRRNPDGLSRAAIGAELRRRHGTLKTDMTPSAILEWCRELELVGESPSPAGQVFWLSDTGGQWASRLPELRAWDAAAEEVPFPSASETAEVELFDDLESAVEGRFMPVPFAEVASQFSSDDALSRFVFAPNFLALLHGALHALPHKRFVLLSGLSGTGKTSLAEAYARAYCAAAKVPTKDHMLRVPVSPDWSDPSGLLGYISPLGSEPTFHGTQALEFLLLTSRNPIKPYFLCLDEMNLARVEHYFAPFLSAMEGERGLLFLHGARDAVDNVPSKIPWPQNLFIIGTVNMDETTHAFSDKVLDRAFSFELWDVNLAEWRRRAASIRNFDEGFLDAIYTALVALHDALRPARRHFGYRTCDEILGFCHAVPVSDRDAALDAAVLAKILPKIRGDDSGPLPAALEAAAGVCKSHNLIQSAEKITAMRESLRSLGIVRFSS